MVLELTLYVVFGALFWTLAKRFPDRKVHEAPEWKWDLIGIVAAVVFIVLYDTVFDAPLFNLAEGWTGLVKWQNQTFDHWSVWLILLVYFVLADFGTYWGHRLLHQSWLWKHHRFHHTLRNVNVLSGLRAGFVHILFSVGPYTIAAVFVPVTNYETLLTVIMVFTILNQHYLHSNLNVPGARWLEWVLMTPRAHLIHHVAREEIANANFGTFLTVWDRLFGTWVSPDEVSPEEHYGLDDVKTHWRMIFGLSVPEDRSPS
ncbi:MAG: sterol desaturase family protein [Hahellaceae bacterium]|nr:sterol desaturase family protein [Hahellaceae bacterium]